MKNKQINGEKLVILLTLMKDTVEKEQRSEDNFKRGCQVGRVSAYTHMIELVEENIKQQNRKPKIEDRAR
jgi:hypothetical protein